MKRSAAIWLLFILLANALMVSGGGGACDAGAQGRDASRAVTLIYNVYDLQNMSKDLEGSYELANDIDASDTVNWNDGAGFEPIGDISNRFTGSLDGKNHVIKGLFIDRPNTDDVGLFGFIYNGGSINNTGLVDVDVTGGNQTGALAGLVPIGTVNNSYSTGNVIGQGYTGGLGGYVQGTVANSYATGDVRGHVGVGGLLGCGGGSEENSYATGNVSGDSYVGGLLGYMQNGEVSNAYATGDVVGSNEVGGLIGCHNRGVISKSYATGDVVGDGAIEGINYIGGFIGLYYDGDVSESYALGNVTAQGDDIGGFAGYVDSCAISNTYARGNVAGTGDDIGGFAGSVSNSNVSDSYATGYATGTGANIGGFVGYNSGTTVSDCFWDTETSGLSTSNGGTGKTTKEMKTRSTFTDAGWDFENIWHIIEHVTYPIFQEHNLTYLVADAGIDQTVDQHTVVTFNGSGSRGSLPIINYTWTFPDQVPRTLYGVQPTYQFDEAGIFIVTLNVTDSAASWGTDTVTLTVRDITAPAADAGPDQMVDDGTLVTLNGSGSSDNVGIVNYTWKFMDVVAVTVYGVQPGYLFDNPGVFLVTLNVTDAAGNRATDSTNITVIDTASPVADAGPDQEIDEGTRAMFDGSASHDNVGIVNYTWTFTDRARVTLYGVHPTYQFDFPGIFIVTLNVTDAAGNWATGTTTVTVDDVFAPDADAGPDQTVEKGTMVIFDGSGSSDTGGIINYTWTFTDDVPVTLYGIRPIYKFDDPGIFVATLTVKDAAGHRGTDTMTVTVIEPSPPVNHPPRITSIPPTDATVGVEYFYKISAVDPDNDTLTFSLDSPPAGMIIDPGSGRLSWTPSEAGIYPTRAAVKDGHGGSCNQTFDIVASPAIDPVCAIGYPTDGSTVSGIINIIGSAANGTFALVRIEVQIDNGNWIPTFGLENWTLSFDTRTLVNGQHTIKARAQGGQLFSDIATVTVSVKNAAPRGNPPVWTIFVSDQFPWLLLAFILIIAGIMIALYYKGRDGLEK